MYLGIEIGGTKLQLGVGDGSGPPLVELVRRDIDIPRGAEGILAQIRSAAPELISRHRVERVGFGFGGPIEPIAGRVVTSHQVAGWDGFALVDWCQRELGAAAVLGNDADLAGLAEARYGAGRDYDPVFYITVGTGIGGGLIVDGSVYRGSGHGAAELGHLRPGLAATGAKHTLESLASGPGIVAATQRRLATLAETHHDVVDLQSRAGGNLDRLTAQQVAEAAAAGNTHAQAAWHESLAALGWGVAQVITLVAPAAVVIGGGVPLSGEKLFYEPLRAEVERYVFPPFQGKYKILPPALGEEMVVHGAIALAAERKR